MDALHVINDVRPFPAGARANLSLSSLALTGPSLDSWRVFAQSLDADLAGYQSSPLNYRKEVRTYFLAVQENLRTASSNADIGAILNALVEESDLRECRNIEIRHRTGLRYLLGRARYSGLILFPLGAISTSAVPWLRKGAVGDPPDGTIYGRLLPAIAALAESYDINERDQVLLRTLFGRFALAVDVTDVSDFDDTFYNAFWHFLDDKLRTSLCSEKSSPTWYSRVQGLFNKIFEFMYVIEAERGRPISPVPNFSSKYWLRVKRANDGIGAPSFTWLVKERPDLNEWAQSFSWYIQSQPLKNPTHLVSGLKKFCNFLMSMDAPPTSPALVQRHHIIRRNASQRLTFYEYLGSSGDFEKKIGYVAFTQLRSFFSRWHDEFGDHSRSWSNPVLEHDFDLAWKRGNLSGKTNKEVLPVRLIKLMKEIIVEDDYAWPRTLDSDYCTVYSPSNIYERIWCPARAVALLLLLTIPIRTIQMRLLDSGEGDEFIPHLATNEFIPNSSPISEPGRQEGLLKRIYDGTTQRYYTGLHITTNKSAALSSTEFERPYDIPWQCDSLLSHLEFLLDWQRTYNAGPRKLTRRDLSDVKLRPSEAARNLPGYYFLFRDPANRSAPRDEPVPHGRMRNFFLAVLEEAERRLNDEGEGVQLVIRTKQGLVSPYSLHGLRVSGITHFAEAGVPIQVIAEFVAGHSTLLMSIHYTKFGPSKITDILDEAMDTIEEGWEDELVTALKNGSADFLSRTVANGDDGYQLLRDSTPGIWSIGIDGICPTGRALCDIGGERLSSHNNAYYAPVPGGPRNCARCRFFITGPAFINGQVVAFNNLAFAISERAKDLDRLKRKVAEEVTKGTVGRRLERWRTQVDALEIEIDEMLKTWQARFALIERSRALLHASERDDSNSLISLSNQSDLELVLEHTSEFDLVEFVAQACEVFPEKAEPSAPLRKGKILDQFLKRNGYEPFFYALPDEEALASGNRLTRFLQDKVGRDRLRSLMDGHTTLRSLGLDAEFQKHSGLFGNKERLLIPTQSRPRASTETE
ncbi:VPA1269 family protein [Microvirga massiliensis]|uniref:VPA1269 family protein n=1 Tax=Microvirga massiliensis TaxID=1033741 RepID=UPI00062B70AF|nr:VPA1269 family protein [Microvirga massiliensis]